MSKRARWGWGAAAVTVLGLVPVLTGAQAGARPVSSAGAWKLPAIVPAIAGQVYAYAGKEQTFAVPAGVTAVHVVLVGAPGSPAGIDGGPGYGAKLVADLAVPSGTTTLYVEVGGAGLAAAPPSVPYTGTGGWNGGGGGPYGGGGATDIRTVPCGTALVCASGGSQASLSSRLAVAGGGGGGGGGSNGGNAGEDGSGSGSEGGSLISGSGATVSVAGQPADQQAVTTYCMDHGAGAGGELGLAGSLGLGGAGAYLLVSGANSGGGGGGLYGGAGGAQCYSLPGPTATFYSGSGGAGSSGAPGGQNISLAKDDSDPAQAVITAPVPSATAPPVIIGDLTVGDVLTAGHGTWTSGVPISSYTYAWERCDTVGASCTTIGGAGGQTYTLQRADAGHTVRVEETASNFYGQASTPATSGPSGTVSAPPTTTGTVTTSTATTRPGTTVPARTGTTRPSRAVPVLSRLRVSPGTLSVAGRLVGGRCVRPAPGNDKAPRCRRPVEMEVSYRLSSAAPTTFTFQQLQPGRMTKGHCVKLPGGARRQQSCLLVLALPGKISRTGKTGANAFGFDGRLGARSLGPGDYRLTATPRGGGPRRTTFRILS